MKKLPLVVLLVAFLTVMPLLMGFMDAPPEYRGWNSKLMALDEEVDVEASEDETTELEEASPLAYCEEEEEVDKPKKDKPKKDKDEADEDEDWEEICYYWTVPYNMTETEFEEKFGPEVYKAFDNGYNAIEFVGPYYILADDQTDGPVDE